MSQTKRKTIKKYELVTHTDDKIIVDTIFNETGTHFIIFDRTTKKSITANEIELNGKKYHPVKADSKFITSGCIVFPSKLEEYGTKQDLLYDILDFISTYVDIPEEFTYISAYYVIFTFIYQNFNELSYLRVLGDYGSGKSRLLKVLGHVSFNPIMASSGASTAALNRLIPKFQGTLVIDEADFSNSGNTAGIMRIFNTGYQKGNPVIKCEVDTLDVECIEVYGPKIIGGRNEFSDRATESRCLSNLMTRTKRKDIPTNLDEDFYKEAQIIRNKLLKFRYDYYDQVKLNENLEVGDIEPRLKQIIKPLLSIVDDEEIQKIIVDFLVKKQLDIKGDRKNSIFGGILMILKTKFEKEDVTKICYKEILDDLYLTDCIDVNPNRLGYLFKENGIKHHRETSGMVVRLEDNKEALKRLYLEFGIDDNHT